MKTLLLVIIATTLTSCVNGKFLNRTPEQWGDIGFNTGKRAIPIVVEEYNNIDLTSSK